MPRVDPFDMPFEEAVKYFSRKVPMPIDEFLDLAAQARVRAFSVSGIAGIDALDQIKESVTRAIEEGLSFGEWRKLADPVLSQWGLGGFRAETIFRSNIQTAYQVGHYQQMHDPDVLRDRPYWRYVAVMDERTRPEHAAWHDTVLPADDPWWDTHYPPNGYNCRCTVVSLSPGEVEREGLEVMPSPKIDTYEWVDKRTGEVHEVPRGIDPGWDVNPGKLGMMAGLL
jgi:SPP1 gp7 family putative phage head morphogenesis protein